MKKFAPKYNFLPINLSREMRKYCIFINIFNLNFPTFRI